MTRLCYLLCVVLISSALLAQSSPPTVISGEIPTYPLAARMAGVQGKVELKVGTDGVNVHSITIVNGAPLLATAAENNVRSWKFAKHAPTTFITKFLYQLTTYNSCEDRPIDNGRTILKLPSEVEIENTQLSICDPGPDAELSLSEPLRVFLTSCKVDGANIPCDALKIELLSGAINILPKRFKDADGKQGFIVPNEFRSLKDFTVRVQTDHGTFNAGNNIAFLKGDWQVGVDHSPFKEDTPISNVPKSEHCVGFIVFEWGEPERVAYSKCE